MIIICEACKGVGRIEFDVGTHKSEYKVEDCGICKGSGRMDETIIRDTTRKPFIPERALPTRL